MNRQEAVEILMNLGYDDYDKRNDEAMSMAIAALKPPTPDPDTGLMPCGCGGKPRVQHNPRRKMPYRVACPLCFMQADTAKTEDDAKFFWNHGHGYVPGREGTV